MRTDHYRRRNSVRRQFIPEDWMILQEAKKYKRNLKSVKDVQVN